MQSPILGDTVRLQSFVLSNAMAAKAKAVAKVEIYAMDQRMATTGNPRGLMLMQTVVSHLGQPTREVYGYPSDASPEYWETKVYLDPDTFVLGDYIDRWYYIFDPDFTFANPVPNAKVSPEDDFRGITGTRSVAIVCDPAMQYVGTDGHMYALSGLTVSDAIEVTGAFGANGNFIPTRIELLDSGPVVSNDPSSISGTITEASAGTGFFTIYTDWFHFPVDVGANRKIRIGGITDGSTKVGTFGYTEVKADVTAQGAIGASGVNEATNPDFVPPSDFFGDPASIMGILTTDYANEPNHDGINHYVSGDSVNGLDWTFSVRSDFDTPTAYAVDAMVGDYVLSGGLLMVRLHFSGTPPPTAHFTPWFVDEWQIEGVTYSPGSITNAWDSLWERTDTNKKVIAEHEFVVRPEQWFASPRPIVMGWQFDLEPAEYYVDTVQYLRVSVSPVIPLNPELSRYHYSLLAAGQMTWVLYEGSTTSAQVQRITSGDVFWHEENAGIVKLDTRTSPLNRALEGFFVFFVVLPDGTQIRSSKIVVKIIDDLRVGTASRGGLIF